MLRGGLLVAFIASLALVPVAAVAAPEVITLVPVSIDLPNDCDQRIQLDSIPAEIPKAVSVNPRNSHCWFAAFSVACCDSYYWYTDSLDWIITDFPPKAQRKNWCGPCDLPPPPPPVSRCDDYLVPAMVFRYTFPDFREPASIAVNPSDNSLWIAEPAQIVHIDKDGGMMWRGWDYGAPKSLSVNTADHSCWVADTENNAVVHLSSSGSTAWRGTTFLNPTSVSANSTDGSVWVADNGHFQVVHLSKSGTELWRGAPCPYPIAVAVNSDDGSCWVADPHTSEVIKLDVQGQVVKRVSVYDPRALAVNSTHGDVWVAGTTIVHLDPDGTVRDSYPIAGAGSVSVNTTDDTLWVADTTGNKVTQLAPVCSPFCDIGCWFWAVNEIVACYNAELVQGYHETNELGEDIAIYHYERVVTRDQMAVYIARALAGGDGSVPPPPLDLHFKDLLYSGWATKYIEYCYSQNVVKGYEDGRYHPSDPVNRGQMAVYIARAIVEPHGEEGLASYTPPTTPTFPDVDASFWAFKHIEYCFAQGVVKGYLDLKYYPENLVTRDQMAVYVSRAFQLPAP